MLEIAPRLREVFLESTYIFRVSSGSNIGAASIDQTIVVVLRHSQLTQTGAIPPFQAARSFSSSLHLGSSHLSSESFEYLYAKIISKNLKQYAYEKRPPVREYTTQRTHRDPQSDLRACSPHLSSYTVSQPEDVYIFLCAARRRW